VTIDLPSVEETAEQVRKTGRKAIAIRADVGDPDDVNNMVQRTVNELSGVDILVNNAGILHVFYNLFIVIRTTYERTHSTRQTNNVHPFKTIEFFRFQLNGLPHLLKTLRSGFPKP
jgi:NAD(P)-dependent dehydrogenase (short-subunit alcohol dehydrogenase family)